jgi:hypothetical protein
MHLSTHPLRSDDEKLKLKVRILVKPNMRRACRGFYVGEGTKQKLRKSVERQFGFRSLLQKRSATLDKLC